MHGIHKRKTTKVAQSSEQSRTGEPSLVVVLHEDVFRFEVQVDQTESAGGANEHKQGYSIRTESRKTGTAESAARTRQPESAAPHTAADSTQSRTEAKRTTGRAGKNNREGRVM
jgi:hypothetical protein